MPFRRWYAIVVINGREHRFGPYPTRRAAARKAESHAGEATQATVFYDHKPPPPVPRRTPTSAGRR
jgi:hypothetical protein